MGTTKIEWTEKTWNPVTGCTPISAGCAHCYARRMAKRLAGRCGYPEAPHEFDVTLHPEKLDEPLRWRKPARVFVCSMSDLFHEDVPFEYVDKIMAVMGRSQQHTFQILTKRPERMVEYFAQDRYANILREARGLQYRSEGMGQGISDPSRFGLPNVWAGVTAENQEQADKRIPVLLQIPATVRFVSVEPMLGPVDFARVPGFNKAGSAGLDIVRNLWIIAGGETGPGARPMHPGWVRSLRDRCQSAGVPFFFKSWGDVAPYTQIDDRNFGKYEDWPNSEHIAHLRRLDVWYNDDPCPVYAVGKKAAGRLLDGREWIEYPA